jgi:hypothetical protein
MAAVVKWTFTDPVLSETYTFDVNPNAGGTPPLEKSIQYLNTSAPDGKTLAFEGRSTAQTSSFSGTILEESQYTVFEDWYRKRNQIYMTDDLGRSYTIYITKFEAQRVRARSHPWKHTYTVTYFILDWA